RASPLALTVTDWLTAPGFNCTFRAITEFTVTVMPVYTPELKPGDVTVRLYTPIGSSGKRYSPAEVDTVETLSPVASLVATTFAPGINAPEVSLTTPAKDPRTDCPSAGSASSMAAIIAQKAATYLICTMLLSCVTYASIYSQCSNAV